jgi:hypothetical protein
MPKTPAQETAAMPAYKTIVLELLQEQPELYEQLRSSKRLLPTLDAYATELKASHDAWTDRFREANPDRDQSQLASVALEMAIQELQERLPAESPPDDSTAEPPSLDEAMAYLRRHTPPA